MKYLGVSLTKELKNLYTKNYKTLLKKIKEDPNKWKKSPYTGRLSIVIDIT